MIRGSRFFCVCRGSHACCCFLSVSRYILKIADIFGIAPIYLENRRYNWSYDRYISKIADIIYSKDQLYNFIYRIGHNYREQRVYKKSSGLSPSFLFHYFFSSFLASAFFSSKRSFKSLSSTFTSAFLISFIIRSFMNSPSCAFF